MKNGKGSSAHHPTMTGAAAVPSYVIDASSSGVYPADFEESVKEARKRWVAILTWRGLLPADKTAQV